MKISRTLAALLLSGLAAPALAHPGHGSEGLMAGLAHPVGGLDHLLAMVAVGLWAAQQGGRALWAVPAAFVSMLLVGGLLGMAGIALPLVETGIVGSVILFGGLLLGAARLPVQAGMALVGVFALFHGYAHGAEMPQAASALTYALGFVLATALLHISGALAGLAARAQLWALRAGGAAITGAGLALATGVL